MGGIFTHRFGLVGTPAPAPTDPDFASTVLLLSCNGANTSTTFTDESAAARGNATVTGNAQVANTPAPKFGSGSLRCDGSGDLLSYADSADWAFGSGEFTLEGWFLFDTAKIESDQILVSQWLASTNQRSWLLQYLGGSATNTLQFAGSGNGTSTLVISLTATWTPTADTWYHIAVDRDGNVWRMYVDGTMVDSDTVSTTLHDSTTELRLGANPGGTPNYFHGNIDEPRITKGVGRYASDGGFTVPSAAYPRS